MTKKVSLGDAPIFVTFSTILVHLDRQSQNVLGVENFEIFGRHLVGVWIGARMEWQFSRVRNQYFFRGRNFQENALDSAERAIFAGISRGCRNLKSS